MEEQRIEELLTNIKKETPVNQLLKKKLRKEFKDGSRKGFYKKISSAVAVVAVLICISMLFFQGFFQRNVSAATLKIADYTSIVDIGGGSGLSISEYKGSLFVPVAGKGIFSFSLKGSKKVIDGDIASAAISKDGEKLLYTASGSLYLFDLSTGKHKKLFDSDTSSVMYENPSWGPYPDTVIFTKKTVAPLKTHGFEVKEQSIFKLDLKTMKSVRLADGNNGSMVSGKDALVFERDGEIMYKDLKNNKEVTINQGRFPSVSPDGRYVAFVKVTLTEQDVGKNANIVENIEDIWIADIDNLKSIKKVTSNYTYKFISEKEWLDSIKPTKLPQSLAYNGTYSFYNPVWSSDSRTLYALKNSNAAGEKPGNMKIIKIQFTRSGLSAAQTLEQYMQALLTRDEEFAKSLMKNPPDTLTMSNPVQTGYEIAGSGTDNGKAYVDVRAHWSYTGNPWYRVDSSRYYLIKGKNGYLISSITNKDAVELYEKEGSLWLSEGKNDPKKLLSISGMLPSKDTKASFGPLAYHSSSKTFFFSIQNSDTGKNSVSIYRCNLDDGSASLISKISEVNGKRDVLLSRITLSSAGEFAALDMVSGEDPKHISYTRILDINNGNLKNIEDVFGIDSESSTQSIYWEDTRLVFNLFTEGQSIKFIFDSATGQVKAY